MKFHVQHIQGYIRDADDAFDSTFATIWFRVPEWTLPLLQNIPLRLDGLTPEERFFQLMKKLDDPKSTNDPDVQKALQGTKPIIEQIVKFANEGKDK